MTRYYLGSPVIPLRQATAPVGWVWAMWPDGRWFLHWADQLTETPWGELDGWPFPEDPPDPL